MINVITYSTLYFDLTLIFLTILIIIICYGIHYIFRDSADDSFDWFYYLAKTISFMVIVYMLVPFFSFFYFNCYLGGIPSWFSGIPNYKTTKSSDIYSMSYNGNNVPESQYIPTLKLASEQIDKENAEYDKARGVTRIDESTVQIKIKQ